MDDNRLADIERRLEGLDKRQTNTEKALERSRAAMNSMIPPQTRVHMRAAGREQLMVVRSLLDYWIDRLGDKPSQKDDKPESGRENIPID
jgi:hypothetical protein